MEFAHRGLCLCLISLFPFVSRDSIRRGGLWFVVTLSCSTWPLITSSHLSEDSQEPSADPADEMKIFPPQPTETSGRWWFLSNHNSQSLTCLILLIIKAFKVKRWEKWRKIMNEPKKYEVFWIQVVRRVALFNHFLFCLLVSQMSS